MVVFFMVGHPLRAYPPPEATFLFLNSEHLFDIEPDGRHGWLAQHHLPDSALKLPVAKCYSNLSLIKTGAEADHSALSRLKDMNSEFVEALKEAMDNNRGAVMATVVETTGSVPREIGARMLVFPHGETFGTIGGGALEKKVTDEAALLMGAGKNRFLSIELKSDLDMECGGKTKILLETVGSTNRLVLFGGGHISHALYTLSPLLGMRPVIIDERPEFCNGERFPGASLYPMLPEKAVENLKPGEHDHVIIVTHQHKLDLESLRLVVGLPVAYLGMIGSKQKVKKTLDQLRSEGVSETKLHAVHAPIGLNIGGRTPGAIAISIAAQIVATSHGNSQDDFSW